MVTSYDVTIFGVHKWIRHIYRTLFGGLRRLTIVQMFLSLELVRQLDF